MAGKVVLAYSGGLDTSAIIPWLKETYDMEVIAYCADLGQGVGEPGVLEKKAIASGASKCIVDDLTEEFIVDYIWPTLKAHAVYETKYLLGTSFARPLIAKKMMELVKKEGAVAVAHGATGKGNDQVRFELTFLAIDPDIKIIAPWKQDNWTLKTREDCVDYCEKHNVPVAVSKKKIYSEDDNIWHISHEGGNLEDETQEPNDDVYTMSVTPENAPDKAEYVTVAFEKGIPVSVNGKKLSAVEIVKSLNEIAGRNAVGQIDIVENRLVGMKSRGVYETPAGTILYYAHNELENLVLDKRTFHYKEGVAKRYADLVYNGEWFTPLREALDAFVDSTQENVTGEVKMKLYKGNIRGAGASSKYSLYSQEIASFDDDEDVYNQKDANGFISLFGLDMKTRAKLGLSKIID